MVKKIKKIKKVIATKIANGKLQRMIDSMNFENKVLQDLNMKLSERLDEAHVSIGQWQSKLLSVQTQYDAFRVAQSNVLEPFKNLLRQEASLFQEANQFWAEKINKLENNYHVVHDVIAINNNLSDQAKRSDEEYIKILKRLDALENK